VKLVTSDKILLSVIGQFPARLCFVCACKSRAELVNRLSAPYSAGTRSTPKYLIASCSLPHIYNICVNPINQRVEYVSSFKSYPSIRECHTDAIKDAHRSISSHIRSIYRQSVRITIGRLIRTNRASLSGWV